jgi:hypothetical protein
MVELVLVNGFQIAFPRRAVPELARLPGRVPRSLRLRDRGTTVALPLYRVNLNIAAMLRTLMGVDVGTAGGRSKSAAKAAAARANGLRGGRPRK